MAGTFWGQSRDTEQRQSRPEKADTLILLVVFQYSCFQMGRLVQCWFHCQKSVAALSLRSYRHQDMPVLFGKQAAGIKRAGLSVPGPQPAPHPLEDDGMRMASPPPPQFEAKVIPVGRTGM
ncbi:hypothetical protein H920_08145 [Fukomys damarensis]|uniref:Uncharacterized protein n=1 Tax=Fukomys damarensis TaxID=885580 RepID=A0A091DE72_FUKDA|nr:hypothetical protein H920_08145 [Fukomys damarensis]